MFQNLTFGLRFLRPRIVSPGSQLDNRVATEPLNIRGASRPSTVDRIRRNALPPAPTNARIPLAPPRPVLQTKVVEVWRQCVKRRWNPEARFLNLEVSDFRSRLNKLFDNSASASRTRRTPRQEQCSASGRRWLHSARDVCRFQNCIEISSFCTTVQTACTMPLLMTGQVQTVSLANNNFGSGQIISTLAHYLPDLANLSLQNNNLRVWRDIDYVLGKKDRLNKLRELILIGNPVRELEIQNGRSEKFRRLVHDSSTIVATPIESNCTVR
jgi:nuclear RNA export factor